MKKFIIPIIRTLTLPLFLTFILYLILIQYIKWLWNFEFDEDSTEFLKEAKEVKFKDLIDYLLYR